MLAKLVSGYRFWLHNQLIKQTIHFHLYISMFLHELSILQICIYEVWQKSNETDFFIYERFYCFQTSMLSPFFHGVRLFKTTENRIWTKEPETQTHYLHTYRRMYYYLNSREKFEPPAPGFEPRTSRSLARHTVTWATLVQLTVQV